MSKTKYDVDLCIIGAGSGGLSVASGAAQLGRSVVLFEAEDMGGDCLNHGCVPSKALIAAAKHAHAFSTGSAFGIQNKKPAIDFEKVKAHIKGVIATIAPVDSQERFEGLGVTVIRERARFKNDKTVESATAEVTAKRFVVATGSRAVPPPIPGLDQTPYLTNETIFDVDVLPEHLLIIGAGPIGLELGQAFCRLGSKVEIFDIAAPLSRAEPKHAEVLLEALTAEGIIFHAPTKLTKVRKTNTGVAIDMKDGSVLKGSHLLIAAGRKPSTDGLNLDAAGIKTKRDSIVTDKYLRSSNKAVYAVGDVSGRGGLTHAAGYHASIIIKNFYFVPFLKARADTPNMPAVIYTQPELASIGMTETHAHNTYAGVKTVHFDFAENDRAISERTTQGGVKIITRSNGRIIGASILGEHAGDLLQIIGLAIANKQKIISLTKYISPYPTRAEAVKRAASSYYTDAVFSDKSKRLAQFMTKLQ